MVKIILKPRPETTQISDRLLLSVQTRLNKTLNWLPNSFKKSGFGTSPYIDEWFDWSWTDKDFWSMANHLFLVDSASEGGITFCPKP